MSSKTNKKNESKSKQKSWNQCTSKCKLFFTTVSSTVEHICPEKFSNIFESDANFEQLWSFKNLVFLNTIEQPKGNTT